MAYFPVSKTLLPEVVVQEVIFDECLPLSLTLS